MIPFLSLSNTFIEIREPLMARIDKSLSSGIYIGGDEVKLFENDFSKYIETEHCIGVGNGYDALKIILMALELPRGSQVIIPNNTFIATALSVIDAGLEICVADVDPKSRNISCETISELICSKTSAVIAVHLFGVPAELTGLRELCDNNGLYLIEDCAQAHGATRSNKKIGSSGSICAWSFYPGKNLGAFGDAGAITTSDDKLAAACKAISNYGSSEKYVHKRLGVNSRLDPIQAIVLSQKLVYLPRDIERRREIASRYKNEINNSYVRLPEIPPGTNPSWHLFVIEAVNSDRDELQKFLTYSGIQTLIHYPTTILKQSCFSDLVLKSGNTLVSDRLVKSILSLPMGMHLTDDQISQIISVINAWRPNDV